MAERYAPKKVRKKIKRQSTMTANYPLTKIYDKGENDETLQLGYNSLKTSDIILLFKLFVK